MTRLTSPHSKHQPRLTPGSFMREPCAVASLYGDVVGSTPTLKSEVARSVV